MKYTAKREIADGVNALIYTGRDDLVNAGLSAAAMIPFVGWGATGGKAVNKVVKYGDDVVDVATGAVKSGGMKLDLQFFAKKADDVVEAAGKKVDDVVEGVGITGKWSNPDGSVKWPPNNGAVRGTEEIVTLKPGEEFGRIGSDYGKYVAPTGTDAKALSLSPDTNMSLYKEYTVVKEIPNVEQVTVAPWFDQPGGGIQKLLPLSIDELLRDGYIVKK